MTTYTREKWVQRLKSRSDLSGQVVHFTRSATIDEKPQSGLEMLQRILRERVIKGSGAEGYIRGSHKAVCFQDAPLYYLCQNLEAEYDLVNGKPRDKCRYEPFGLMFMNHLVYKAGGRPVIYDDPDLALKYLSESEWWRIVSYKLSDTKSFIDWTHEREWRLKGDFSFNLECVTVLVPNWKAFHQFMESSRNANDGMCDKVKAVIPLASILV